ncbi:MAG TPA: L-fucose:H+ symporter permease, partial [Gammaproteobacteria bacterium]|nr:L-fucose:H+ symporter permease [Gammaproteobacteria bacterium]
FILVTSLFALWGFANDLTNPLVKVFKEVLQISNTQSSLIQVSFYLGYFTMALPAAVYVRRYGYKPGIALGLLLYSVGAFLTYPAAATMNFWFFVAALYVLTFGLAFLETSANPYILSLGPADTATRRLNLAQAFNPMGSLLGMFVAASFVMSQLTLLEKPAAEKAKMMIADPGLFQSLQVADLALVSFPYLAVGAITTLMFLIFVASRLPEPKEKSAEVTSLGESIKQLASNKQYREGVLAQAFYVGAQISCWTYIIHYGVDVLGLSGTQSQHYNIAAMVLFLAGRFVCLWLMRIYDPAYLLRFFSSLAAVLIIGAMIFDTMLGLYCLIAVSGCMSLMFPTIYGLSLSAVGSQTQIASAGMVMAIAGGALMPFLQAVLIDMDPFPDLFHAVQFSFVLPLACFSVVAWYALRRTFR